MTVLARQHGQVTVYENMSHFTPELKGENKNAYFGTKENGTCFIGLTRFAL